MRKILQFLVVVMSMAGLSRPAYTQEKRLMDTLSIKLSTVVSVVENEGYHPSRELLNCVLKVSGIKFSEVTRLPVGTKVYINDTCIQTVTARNSSKPQAAAQQKVASTSGPITQTTLVVFDSAALKQVEGLKRTIADTVRVLNEQAKSSHGWFTIQGMIMLLAGIVFGVVTVLGFELYQKKRRVLRPRPQGTPHHQMDSDRMPTR